MFRGIEQAPESLAEYQQWAYAQAKRLRTQQTSSTAALMAEFVESLGDFAWVVGMELERLRTGGSDGEEWKRRG